MPTVATGSPGSQGMTSPSSTRSASSRTPDTHVDAGFEYFASAVLGPGVLEQTAPTPTTYVQDVDWGYLSQSDPGEVTAPVTAVDLQLGLGNTSTAAARRRTWPGSPRGNIALVQRGTCTFELKIENAAAAGAVGAVLFNQGNTTRRQTAPGFPPSPRRDNTSGIPGIGATYARGVEWVGRPQVWSCTSHANVVRELKTTYNVFAETPGGDADNVVMAGAHLDSVGCGSGHQRQRHRLGRDPRGRRADVQGEAEEQGPLRPLGR